MSETAPPPASTPAAEPTHEGAFTCPNCGHQNKGRFCTSCGQKEIHPGDLSLKHAWHHVVHELLHVDGKIFTTLKLLITRPGQLTVDFWAGRRAQHVHPIRLFLLVGVAFFLFAHDVDSPLSWPASFSEKGTGFKGLDEQLARKGISPGEFAAGLNAKTARAAKPIFIGVILLQGLSLWLLFRGQRAYLAEHMVMALHLATFEMLFWMAIGWLVLVGVSHSTLSNATVPAGMIYFLFAGRRTYGGSWPVLLGRWVSIYLFSVAIVVLAMVATLGLILLTHR